MIYLTKGQQLFDNPGMVVYDQTGYYDDGSSVICAAAYAPEEPLCRYEAKFIAYGNLVYNITDPEKLMEQVLEIDQKSLFGKNNQDVATDKVVENIQTVDSADTPIETPQTTSPVAEPQFTNPQEVAEALSTSTPATSETPTIVDTPIDTSIEIIPIDTSTTTPLTTIVENTSTTTPLTDITF
ncbi:MAG: hypothetical protein RL292_447 [Candidatus Parcubacteria bacterium]|jgi:hypothetical protein